MKIILAARPLDKIRNRQCGDWTYDDKRLTAIAAKMGNQDFEFLVAFHEMIEAYLCRKRGITDEQVTAFDAMFEKEREQGLHGPDDEDGDDPRAPYHFEHAFATGMEKMMAAELGVDWTEYEAAISALFADDK
jgi:hypothetical protein